jgi:hypothetical protein
MDDLKDRYSAVELHTLNFIAFIRFITLHTDHFPSLYFLLLCSLRESNSRPFDYETNALPAEPNELNSFGADRET